mmetsp:Transcript_3545/g.6176  ORF Transcript_3545/g.6176 Transcript_3545/m.6176 type:complete len:170 (-) Transcript_3545:84-593(-)
MSETYPCRHGGPGELVAEEKSIFVEAVGTSLNKVHRALLLRASRQEIVAAELIMLEGVLSSKEALRKIVDGALVRLYFGRATADLLRAEVEEARTNARVGIYLAMYLKHGYDFFAMTQQSPEVQREKILDFHTAIGHIETSEGGLAKLLNAQTPCQCLEEAFPSLKEST